MPALQGGSISVGSLLCHGDAKKDTWIECEKHNHLIRVRWKS